MIDWKKEWKPLTILAAVFLCLYFLPVGAARFNRAVLEALALARWYAREHVILCLIPAFFLAGAISIFISRQAVIKYLGADARKWLAYSVASVSGTILAVCSCTVLPLFAGIYRMGAGLGPATAFLYSGPAINVLAIILTARILGPELGIARAVGAILFSVVIGLMMHLLFRKEAAEKAAVQAALPETEGDRPLRRNAIYFGIMVGILVFANWGKPHIQSGIWFEIYAAKWLITGLLALFFAVLLVAWFGVPWRHMLFAGLPAVALAIAFPHVPLIAFMAGVLGLSILMNRMKNEMGEWFYASWDLAKQILPLLFAGVLIAGALLGRPGQEGLIPAEWVSRAVGGNSLQANFFASFLGAFMYFATLTEVPILQGLIGAGMGKGPALALLLAGPALSLPNMLVIRSVIGSKKTATYVILVVVAATISGMIYGALFP